MHLKSQYAALQQSSQCFVSPHPFYQVLPIDPMRLQTVPDFSFSTLALMYQFATCQLLIVTDSKQGCNIQVGSERPISIFYSLFTRRKRHSPLRINGERGLLHVNRLQHWNIRCVMQDSMVESEISTENSKLNIWLCVSISVHVNKGSEAHFQALKCSVLYPQATLYNLY